MTPKQPGLVINNRTITALKLAQARHQLGTDTPWGTLTDSERDQAVAEAGEYLKALARLAEARS